MATWRTHHKRAARVRRNDVKFIAECDDLVAAITKLTAENAFARFAEELTKAFTALGVALASAGEAVLKESVNWKPPDPRFRRLRKPRWEWPDIVLEDILDAEFVGE